ADETPCEGATARRAGRDRPRANAWRRSRLRRRSRGGAGSGGKGGCSTARAGRRSFRGPPEQRCCAVGKARIEFGFLPGPARGGVGLVVVADAPPEHVALTDHRPLRFRAAAPTAAPGEMLADG